MNDPGELILFQTEDGQTRIDVRLVGETVWLSAGQIGDLFQRDKSVILKHIKNVFAEGELKPEATVANFATVQIEGEREVTRDIEHYSLDVIISVGYRVKSHRGVQFRVWATQQLRDYLVKGFVLNDENFKQGKASNYFDLLLARIREIRASEKRFYQKVRDLFALSSDYQAREKETGIFFAEVQNKLLFAATLQTAAELIVTRSNPGVPNMALTAWSGSRVRKQDVIIAKNYLTEDEVDTLNRLVVIFLEQAELRAKKQQELTLDYWRTSVDRMLTANDQPLLKGPGNMSNKAMKTIAHDRYESFDSNRRSREASQADTDDLKAIEALEKSLKRKGGGK